MANCHGFFSLLWPGQSSDRPNLPPHKKLSIFQFPFASIRRATSEACSGLGKRRIESFQRPNGSSKKLQRATITAFFLDRSLCIVTGHDRLMTVTSRRTCAYFMPVDLLPVLAVDLLVQQATACGLPEVFHVSPRSLSIAARRSSPVVRAIIMPAIRRSEVFQLQANDVTWPGVACVCKSMKLGMHRV